VLDPDLAARIAAGEVVERPASVVKELLENAIDAGATRIRVEIVAGGMDRIRVIDDGCGIGADEVLLAFERHATSKLFALDDLSAIGTLGFRGEALPSIAAVSTIVLRTRPPEAASGTSVVLQQGQVVDQRVEGLPPGTTVDITDLFSGLPARRKFLKGRQAEAAAVQGVVAHYAIAYPQIALTFIGDGQTMFSTAGTRDLRDVLACLYGMEVVEGLLDIATERHGIVVRGLTSRVGHTRATRALQSFFVNGRWVRNRVLHVALEEGYHSMLFGGRHPISVMLLEVPPDEVDVNVHPAKSEVRFLREREVFGAIRHAVNAALTADRPVIGAASDPDAVASGAGEPDQLTLLDAEPAPAPMPAAITAPARSLPALRVLGQASALFIIAEGPDGVYMVDQHAAHERVLYDELSEQIQHKAVPVQALLEPALVEVGATAMEALLAYGDVLRQLGFEAEPFGATTCAVRAVPTVLTRARPGDVLIALLEDLAVGKEQADQQDRSLATMACKAAVKAGQSLTMEEMRHLIARLETTSRPRTCPHGRPTMILLSNSALERQFGRR
jgi:DNA mismatch repair protein MutL